MLKKKGWTSRAFNITTKDLGENSQSGDQFFGIHASNGGKVMIFAGGIPIKQDGKVVGAIGVSGGKRRAGPRGGGGGCSGVVSRASLDCLPYCHR